MKRADLEHSAHSEVEGWRGGGINFGGERANYLREVSNFVVTK